MTISRRGFIAATGALAIGGCVPGAPTGGSGGQTAWRKAANLGFDAWLSGFRGRAAAAGVSSSAISQGLRGAGYLPAVIARDRNQTEFTRTLEDYLAIAASDARVSTGKAKLRSQSGTLSAIEARYGVEARIVCAIWGLESRYGERKGDAPVISALATLAYDGRRGSFFEKQLIAALKIIEDGDVSASRMTGSWAGAMGHTQFIPTSYRAFAVDFNGDGRSDIWGNDPTDALASTAAYLQRNGWRRGLPWGAEVILPASYTGPFGRNARQSAASLQAAGIRRADGGSMAALSSAGILIPQGRTGPAFAVTRNFGTLLTYNNSENYALGIGHLSDRIAGGGPIQGNFPPDAYGLTLSDRKALQRGLTRAGFDAGEADGVLGSKTETAIRAYQQANALPVTGKPSPALLARLR
ncbi:lytic murein transglycosylase [Aliishimia ponticola]|uniref:Lytic murein transglycosylase n=1 Tax=Aliishimia ponticola TaxID=2499833 RepID=A0A4S4NDP3_9RHOB|nr:lytic murein transglycosylase [Aliishimia ponticola]THH36171.1 lytic murein transglycosylase [Aliishimia ponticola]